MLPKQPLLFFLAAAAHYLISLIPFLLSRSAAARVVEDALLHGPVLEYVGLGALLAELKVQLGGGVMTLLLHRVFPLGVLEQKFVLEAGDVLEVDRFAVLAQADLEALGRRPEVLLVAGCQLAPMLPLVLTAPFLMCFGSQETCHHYNF